MILKVPTGGRCHKPLLLLAGDCMRTDQRLVDGGEGVLRKEASRQTSRERSAWDGVGKAGNLPPTALKLSHVLQQPLHLV
jgi:hypothetical protein